MSPYVTTFTPLATGNFTIPNGFQGGALYIKVMKPSNSNNNGCEAWLDDSGYIYGTGMYRDNTPLQETYEYSGTTELVRYREKSGSLVVTRNQATFDTSAGCGFFPTTTVINITNINTLCQYKVTVFPA